jgi:hypothetical protein
MAIEVVKNLERVKQRMAGALPQDQPQPPPGIDGP